jgi:energy-converting hydrogenase Eha subunit E
MALSRAALMAARERFLVEEPSPRLAVVDGPVSDGALAIVAALGPRSEGAMALSGVLRRLGASQSTFAAVVRGWFAGVSRNVEDHVRRGSTAWEREAEEVSGYAALEAVVGTSRAELVQAVAHAVISPRRANFSAVPVQPPAAGSVGVLGLLVDPSDESDLDLPYICRGLGLMPYRGKVTFFAGLPGAAKGPTADHVALCVVTGQPIFGTYEVDRPGPVIVLDFEGAVGTKRRLRRMCLDMGVEWPADLHVIEADPLAVDSEVWLEDLSRFVESTGAVMVVVDSYTSAALPSGVDTTKPEFARLAQRLATLGVCVVCVAHAAKGSEHKEKLTLTDVAGSMGLVAMSVCAWGFRQVDKFRVEVSCLRTFEGAPFDAFDVLWSDTHEGRGLHVETSTRAAPVSKATQAKAERLRVERAEALDVRARVRAWILGHPREAWTVAALEARLPYGRPAIKAACVDLEAHGELGVENHGTVLSPKVAYVVPTVPEPAAVGVFRGG